MSLSSLNLSCVYNAFDSQMISVSDGGYIINSMYTDKPFVFFYKERCKLCRPVLSKLYDMILDNKSIASNIAVVPLKHELSEEIMDFCDIEEWPTLSVLDCGAHLFNIGHEEIIDYIKRAF